MRKEMLEATISLTGIILCCIGLLGILFLTWYEDYEPKYGTENSFQRSSEGGAKPQAEWPSLQEDGIRAFSRHV